MRQRMLGIVLAVLFIPVAGQAADLPVGESTTIDLNALDPGNGFTFSFGRGDYVIEPVAGTFSAWDPWGRLYLCSGGRCYYGWATQFVVATENEGDFVGSPIYAADGSRNVWATPELAVSNAVPLGFCLASDQSVTVRIHDGYFQDNLGGLSLQITHVAGLCAALDEDGDGVPNGEDACPYDPANDADGDGVCGDVDVCPGFDDNADADGDGTPDGCDVCPYDPADDADGDGLCADVDACPATPAGALIDDRGCAIEDYCPCDADWKNHGEHVSCVALAAQHFRDAGLITGAEYGSIVSAAAQSDCGRAAGKSKK